MLEADRAELRDDPILAVPRDDRRLEPALPSLGEPFRDAGQERGPRVQLGLPARPAGDHRFAIDCPADQPLEMRHGVERPFRRASAADRGQPVLEREIDAVLRVRVPPGLVRGHLGVDDDAVEVEQQRRDHAGMTRLARSRG